MARKTLAERFSEATKIPLEDIKLFYGDKDVLEITGFSNSNEAFELQRIINQLMRSNGIKGTTSIASYHLSGGEPAIAVNFRERVADKLKILRANFCNFLDKEDERMKSGKGAGRFF